MWRTRVERLPFHRWSSRVQRHASSEKLVRALLLATMQWKALKMQRGTSHNKARDPSCNVYLSKAVNGHIAFHCNRGRPAMYLKVTANHFKLALMHGPSKWWMWTSSRLPQLQRKLNICKLYRLFVISLHRNYLLTSYFYLESPVNLLSLVGISPNTLAVLEHPLKKWKCYCRNNETFGYWI